MLPFVRLNRFYLELSDFRGVCQALPVCIYVHACADTVSASVLIVTDGKTLAAIRDILKQKIRPMFGHERIHRQPAAFRRPKPNKPRYDKIAEGRVIVILAPLAAAFVRFPSPFFENRPGQPDAGIRIKILIQPVDNGAVRLLPIVAARITR